MTSSGARQYFDYAGELCSFCHHADLIKSVHLHDDLAPAQWSGTVCFGIEALSGSLYYEFVTIDDERSKFLV